MIPKTFWLFGRSGAGKTTLAKQIAKRFNIYLIDGDDIREFVGSQDFSEAERCRHLMYVAFAAQSLNKCSVSAVCALITPFIKIQRQLYTKIPNLHLIYIKCSLEEAIRRDVKGLYTNGVPGIDMFEEPETYDLMVDTDNETVDESFVKICRYLEKKI